MITRDGRRKQSGNRQGEATRAKDREDYRAGGEEPEEAARDQTEPTIQGQSGEGNNAATGMGQTSRTKKRVLPSLQKGKRTVRDKEG